MEWHPLPGYLPGMQPRTATSYSTTRPTPSYDIHSTAAYDNVRQAQRHEPQQDTRRLAFHTWTALTAFFGEGLHQQALGYHRLSSGTLTGPALSTNTGRRMDLIVEGVGTDRFNCNLDRSTSTGRYQGQAKRRTKMEAHGHQSNLEAAWTFTTHRPVGRRPARTHLVQAERCILGNRGPDIEPGR